jgi:hypothetical protein
MIEFWLRYNWHWLSAAIVFSAAVLSIAIKTGFICKWAYDTVIYGMSSSATGLHFLCIVDAFVPDRCHGHNGEFFVANACRAIPIAGASTRTAKAKFYYDGGVHCGGNIWLSLYNGKFHFEV